MEDQTLVIEPGRKLMELSLPGRYLGAQRARQAAYSSVVEGIVTSTNLMQQEVGDKRLS